MTKIKTATVVLCKCPVGKKTYGIRFEKIGARRWRYTWAFPVKEDSAKREGYDSITVDGGIEADKDYPGCPYCKAGNFIICCCGKLNCYVNIGRPYSCAWCGESFDELSEYDGSGFQGGGDR